MPGGRWAGASSAIYGFLGGETHQWYPDLVYDNHTVEQPSAPEDGYHLSKDLTDKAIEFVRDAKAVAPDKPWFMYYCPGAGHAPHHVFKEWADRYRGRFDLGYEAIRADILSEQKRLGILPDSVELTPINRTASRTASPGRRSALAPAGLGTSMGLAQRG